MCSKLSPPGIYLLRWGGLGKGVVGWCVRAARLCHGRLGTRQTRTCLNAYPCARHPWSSSESESSAAALQARAIWFWDETAPRAAAHQEYWADTWRCTRSLQAIVKVEVIRSNPTIETQRPLRQRGKLPLIMPLVSGSTWQNFVEVEIRGLFFASVHVCRWATAEGETCPFHIIHQIKKKQQQSTNNTS